MNQHSDKHAINLIKNVTFKTSPNLFCLVSALLAGEVASGGALETNDGVGDLQVSLLLQVSQDPSPEEDFALTHPVQVLVQLQSPDLNGETVFSGRPMKCHGSFCLQTLKSD